MARGYRRGKFLVKNKGAYFSKIRPFVSYLFQLLMCYKDLAGGCTATVLNNGIVHALWQV